MARNKHPEQTVQKILDVSLKLFGEKGYEKTTIQDIVDALGMSKGAIYHHFKSKDDIIEALGNQSYSSIDGLRAYVSSFNDMNGLEKLRMIFKAQLKDPRKRSLDPVMMDAYSNPKFMVMSLRETLCEAAAFGATLIEEGIKDGSIQAQDPLCASQVYLLLINFWLVTPLEPYDEQHIKNKVTYLRKLMEEMGSPIINDELEQNFLEYLKAVLA